MRKVEQHSSLPHGPTPERCLASSRTPIWRKRMRVRLKVLVRSFKSSRKSTRPSEVYRKVKRLKSSV
ncbi:hypothetical protein D3C78_1683330 [compost metagenome]